MYFLIDFENVHNVGLEGFEYLNEEDTVIVFYSPICKTMKKYRMEQIFDSGCEWKIVKLAKAGKNALDFYIATSVGEIFTANPDATIGIVSNDKGFGAVKDYWKARLEPQNKLVQGNSVAVCMSKGYDITGRSGSVKADNNLINMEEEYARYIDNRRVEEKLREAFACSCYEEMIPEIIRIINSETSPKDLYLATIKSFGKKNGLEVYRTLKLCS